MILGLLWGLYSAARSVIGLDTGQAFVNARRVLSFQDWLGLGIEAQIQAMLPWKPALMVANSYYLLHFPVTLGLLAWTYYTDRHGGFVRFRNALIAATAVGLLIHVAFPLAPPRMLSGFTDTGAIIGPDPYSVPGASKANQFAAMPSMHVAWAILVARAAATGVARPFRHLASLHPVLTAIVVVVTANHYVIDVLIGAALAYIAVLVCSTAVSRQPLAPTWSSTMYTGHGPPIPVMERATRPTEHIYL